MLSCSNCNFTFFWSFLHKSFFLIFFVLFYRCGHSKRFTELSLTFFSQTNFYNIYNGESYTSVVQLHKSIICILRTYIYIYLPCLYNRIVPLPRYWLLRQRRLQPAVNSNIFSPHIFHYRDIHQYLVDATSLKKTCFVLINCKAPIF